MRGVAERSGRQTAERLNHPDTKPFQMSGLRRSYIDLLALASIE